MRIVILEDFVFLPCWIIRLVGFSLDYFYDFSVIAECIHAMSSSILALLSLGMHFIKLVPDRYQ